MKDVSTTTYLFLSSSENTSNKSGRISGSRNKSKCEQLTKIIVKYIMTGNEEDVEIHNSWANKFKIKWIIKQFYPTLADLQNIIKCTTSKKLNTRRRLLREGKVNLDSDQSLNFDAFYVGTVYNKVTSQKRLEKATRIIISSILLSNTYSQQ